MAIIRLFWLARADACKICAAINGYVWTFDASTDSIGDTLTHPVYGPVWSMAIGSLAHGHTGLNCRCTVTYDIDISELIERVKQVIATVNDIVVSQMEVGKSWRTRGDARTTV